MLKSKSLKFILIKSIKKTLAFIIIEMPKLLKFLLKDFKSLIRTFISDFKSLSTKGKYELVGNVFLSILLSLFVYWGVCAFFIALKWIIWGCLYAIYCSNTEFFDKLIDLSRSLFY